MAEEGKRVPEFVTLISSDGYSYVISREAAMVSGTLSGMLGSSSFEEARSGKVRLVNMNGVLLEKICEYLCYNLKYRNKSDVPDFDVPPEMALELLVAADFLDSMLMSRIVGSILTAA
jgi:transcription elongation factor B subunit 1